MNKQSETAPPFVLTTADFYGTLAAVRCLGAYGVPVIVADAEPFAPARWSRHVTRRQLCPPVRPLAPFLDWLLEFGSRTPGCVLYATSDDLAWAFSEHQEELGKYYRLVTPPFSSVAQVLDKRELYACCSQVGLPTPRTWFPSDDADLQLVAKEACFPVILKPRTQVLFTSMRKGGIITSPGQLRDAFVAFRRQNQYHPCLLQQRPDIALPMVQEYTNAPTIYGVSGFCDPCQTRFIMRGSHKVVQWPRQAGIGIWFEDSPVPEAIAIGVRRLCELTGVFGVFEAEFVQNDANGSLIDFNPRFFGQLAFDVLRGLPSPYLVYLVAIGAQARLHDEIERASAWRSAGRMTFENRTAIAWTRTVERLVGRIPVQLPDSGPFSADFTWEDRDCVPAVLDTISQIVGALRHPRAALRAAARGY